MTPDDAAVHVLRNDQVESRHRAHVAVARPDGTLLATFGDPTASTFLRSTAKPYQTVPLLTSGAAQALDLTDEEIAVTTASHNGEPAHVDRAARILEKANVPRELLACGTHEPLDDAPVDAEDAGTPLHNNCSGKHAGFLATAQHLGAPLKGYLDPDHPVQAEVRRVLAQAMGVDIQDLGVGVDGCGAPTWHGHLAGIARAAATLADPSQVPDAPVRAALDHIGHVMQTHPWYVAGTHRFDTELMESSTTLVAKAGAEAVQIVANRDAGLGLAIKVEDGAKRAVPPVTMEVLRQLGWVDVRAFETLGDRWRPTLRNHAGEAVGGLDPVLELTLHEGYQPTSIGGPLP